jgi:integrase
MFVESDAEHVVKLPCDRDMARGLRLWLKRAGVDRAELHTATPTRKALTFHDLRATGLTWLAVRGDEPLKIMQRAGHSDFKTTQGYIREAEAVREGFGRVFPPLPPLTKPTFIPAMSQTATQRRGT